jgi:serine/threonine-protein kinase
MKIIALVALAGCSSSPARECSETPGTACTWSGIAGVQGKDETVRDRRDSMLSWPTDIEFSPANQGYIVDWNNHLVRRVEADDTLTSVLGNAVEAEGAPDGTDYLPPNAPLGAAGTAISLNHPTNVDFLPDGKLVICSWHGLRVRVWEPETGLARVIAGDGEYGNTGDGGPAHRAEFNLPRSVVADANGRLYVLDQKNQRVRTFEPSPTAIVSTVAGVGTPGFSGDGGPAIDAQFKFVTVTSLPSGGLAIDGDHLYVSDNGNERIRRITLSTGVIDSLPIDVSLNSPADLAIGPDGRLYVADSYNNVIRRIDLATNAVETVAGTGEPCALGATCLEDSEGLPARDVVLNGPLGIGFDNDGHLYIADTYNNRIVRIVRDW